MSYHALESVDFDGADYQNEHHLSIQEYNKLHRKHEGQDAASMIREARVAKRIKKYYKIERVRVVE